MTNLICFYFLSQMVGLPLTVYPNERIIRIIKMVELKQNGRCISCKELITKDHAAVSSGRPRYYYHKLRHQRPHHMMQRQNQLKVKLFL